MKNNKNTINKVAFILVFLMILLQGFYGVFAYLDPFSFASVRGTVLSSEIDKDWIQIYGSRTVFITSILAYLLHSRHYVILMWCALFGTVMPITDGILAYQADAPFNVVLKHIVTIAYLLITAGVLKMTVSHQKST